MENSKTNSREVGLVRYAILARGVDGGKRKHSISRRKTTSVVAVEKRSKGKESREHRVEEV